MEHLTSKQKTAIMMAIMASMLFAALNQTIIGNIMPIIISKLNGMDYFQWVFTIYMLTSSVTAILAGKLSDIFGRKPLLLIGLCIFILGSFLCGTSKDIIQLIIWRGLQGLGGGVIMSTAFAAVGDLFPPRQRGRWQGIMSGIFGFSSIIGPTIGGYIVDHFDWHWCFWIFLPFGIVAWVLIWKLFPGIRNTEEGSVDIAGSVLLTSVIVPILLAFSWAGKEYAWDSAMILGLFGAAALSLVLFLLVERKAASPVLPLGMFKNSVFTLSNVVNFLTGMGMFGTIMYAPFFIQGVMGKSATASSLLTMPLTLGMVIASIFAGQWMTRTGKYKRMAIIGLFVMAAGMFLLTRLPVDAENLEVILPLTVVGLGLGTSFPVFTLTVQNAVEHRHLGVATSAVQLFRQLGGTIGVSVMGYIMGSSMQSQLQEKMAHLSANRSAGAIQTPAIQDPNVLMNHAELEKIRESLPEPAVQLFDKMIQLFKEAMAASLHDVFLIGCFLVLAATVLSFLVREVPLKTTNRDDADTSREEENASVEVVS
ncbi:MDR family MFS transporter [Staphylospora marina]|uniref:MDR family MFS transporter n=1 Tax=Staphylospora marina TaxID=2490858 RepID=UPI000F5BF924|nr:MDR family MFS transporter [Staphylospora marina]